MNYRFFLLLLALLGGEFASVHAQYGLQAGQLRHRGWSQTYNPAHLATQEFETFQYTGIGTAWLGNNQATLGGILSEGNYITEESKDKLLDQLSDGTVINGGYRLDLAQVNVKLGERTWGFYLGDRLSGTVSLNGPQTLGLILKGNGPYAGQTVSDQGFSANAFHLRALGAATSFSLGEKVQLGVRLNLLQGLRYFEVERANYTLYTSENGTEVDLDADYSFAVTPKFRDAGLFPFQGFGASADAGVVVQLNEKMSLEGALNDIGVISYTVDRKSREIHLENFRGVFIDNILGDSVGEIAREDIDSLANTFLPDSAREQKTLLMPLNLRVGYRYQLGEKNALSATLVYFPFKVGAYTPLPLLNVAYQHEVIDGLTLGANAYGGGYDTYGFGAMGTYRIAAGSASIDLLVGSDNLLGLLVPGIGRGMNLYGGVGVAF